MRPSRWATHSAVLHGLSDRLPCLAIQPTTATRRFLPPSVITITTSNSLIPSPTRPTQAHMRQLLFKHSRAHTLSNLPCYHPPRLIAHCLCRVCICTVRLAVEPPSAATGARTSTAQTPQKQLAANHLSSTPAPWPTPPATSTAQTALTRLAVLSLQPWQGPWNHH